MSVWFLRVFRLDIALFVRLTFRMLLGSNLSNQLNMSLLYTYKQIPIQEDPLSIGLCLVKYFCNITDSI